MNTFINKGSIKVRYKIKFAGIVAGLMLMSACSHMSNLALMSNGDLDGKNLSGVEKGEILTGESCSHTYSLGEAMSNALDGTQYDTLIEISVESTSAIFVFGNCVKVTGKGVNSKLIPKG